MIRLLFNYYVVLKSCWIILFFQVIGFVGLVVMEQGKDILLSLGISATGLALQHTYFALFAVLWWSWQSWRAARVILHFTTFDFINFSKGYATQAQVLIPRVLGITPILIFMVGIFNVSGWSNPLLYILANLAFWLYVFYYLRKEIIVMFLSRNKYKLLNIPDYVTVKNEAYPASFIWAKQSRWIWFRFSMIILVFTLVILHPVRFPQYMGAATIILFALGGWLVIATLLDFAEKHYRFPFTFSIIAMVIGFSFFNNNHKIRTINQMEKSRPSLNEHFDSWYQKRALQNNNDTVPIIMIALQGGGVRSAYWTAQVLSDLQESNSQFADHVYAYSSVSGGSLGVATFKALQKNNIKDLKKESHRILSKDFLAPVTSWLVVPDLAQKFLPFPIYSVDRARALEYSWENAATLNGKSLLSDGFLANYQDDESAFVFNSTRVENGFRTLLSNVRMDRKIFSLSEDFFDVTQTDIPLSTAVSVSSRFPFITPPALVMDKDGEKWGHLVDGGYVENMGGTALLEMYDHIRKHVKAKNYKANFYLLFIKNTKEEYNTTISGMYEILGPLNTFSKVWVNSGYYDENNTKLNNLYNNDKAVFISLERLGETIIPLGWYLSEQATKHMQNQLEFRTAAFRSELQSILPKN